MWRAGISPRGHSARVSFPSSCQESEPWRMTGKQLRKLRLARGISTDKAAKAVGVSRRTWVRWEANGAPATAAKLIALIWKE